LVLGGKIAGKRRTEYTPTAWFCQKQLTPETAPAPQPIPTLAKSLRRQRPDSGLSSGATRRV